VGDRLLPVAAHDLEVALGGQHTVRGPGADAEDEVVRLLAEEPLQERHLERRSHAAAAEAEDPHGGDSLPRARRAGMEF
jgi:hypothetical protein